ncbi:MAG: DUF58 domain-containing protein [Nitrospinota bacterium]
MPAPPGQSYFDPHLIARIATLPLKARWVVEGLMSGVHRSRARGFSVEFEEHRAYSPGDEIRHIDWKAFGRFDRYLIKEYEEETNLRAHLVVDASASMDYASEGITKWDYACYLTAALAYLALRQQDAVGLLTCAGTVGRRIPPKATRRHLLELLDALERQRPRGQTGLAEALGELAAALRRRGLVVVASDLLAEPEPLLRALQLFRLKGNDVIVFHILDPAELHFPFEELTRFEDLETLQRVTVEPEVIRETYHLAVRRFVETYRKACREHQVDYVLLDTSVPLDRGLVRYLAWRKAVA